MKTVRLEVDRDNTAIEFYKKAGFQIIGRARPESYYMEMNVNDLL